MRSKLRVQDCLCQNLRKTSRLLTLAYDQALRPAGLRMSQFTVLATLAEMGATTHAPLAEYLGMDRTTLSRNLELMERDGYVQMEAGVEDRRQQTVRLTERGRESLAQAMPLWEAIQRKALQRVVKGGSGLGEFLQQLAALTKTE